jgi:hypothetical protein
LKRIEANFDFKLVSKLNFHELFSCMSAIVENVVSDFSNIKFCAKVCTNFLLEAPSCGPILTKVEQKYIDYESMPNSAIHRIYLEAFHCEIYLTEKCTIDSLVETLFLNMSVNEDLYDIVFLLCMNKIFKLIAKNSRDLYKRCMSIIETIHHKQTSMGLKYPTLNNLSEIDENKIHTSMISLVEQLTDNSARMLRLSKLNIR